MRKYINNKTECRNCKKFLITVSAAITFTYCGSPPASTPAPAPAPVNNPTPAVAPCLINLNPPQGTPPITTVAFTATGITEYPGNLVGGVVPLADNTYVPYTTSLKHGGMTAGSITIAPGNPLPTANIVGNGVDGNIYINVTGEQGGNPYGQTVNATGTFTFSASKLSTIAQYIKNLLGYYATSTTPSSYPYCISSMAMDLSFTNYGKVDGGRIFFYINQPNYPSGVNSVNYPNGYYPLTTATGGSQSGQGIVVFF